MTDHDHFTAAYNAPLAMRDANADAEQIRAELDIARAEFTRITTLLVGAGYRTLVDIDDAMASLIELRDRAEVQQEALRIAGYEGPDALSRALERLGVLEDTRCITKTAEKGADGWTREYIGVGLPPADPKVADVMRQMEPKKPDPRDVEIRELRKGMARLESDLLATRRKLYENASVPHTCTPPIDPHTPTVFVGTGNTLPMSGCEVPKTERVETLGWASRK